MITNMEKQNEAFTITIENVNLHFVIHYESFVQQKNPRTKASHSHLYYEILYSLNDCNRLHFDDVELGFKKHQFALIPPYFNHNTYFEKESDLISVGFYYKKNQSKYQRYDLWAFLNKHFEKKFRMGALDAKTGELFMHVHNHFRPEDPVHTGLLLSSLSQILFKILLSFTEEDELNEQIQGEMHNGNMRLYYPKGIPLETLYEINEILNARYAEEITPSSLSKQFFVSSKQINRYIYRQYGQTFLQRRTKLRMAAAQKLLSETDEPINRVAEMVGYGSINTFYSAFKTFSGTTPDAYRRKFGII